jgi:hypothetical protein
MAALDFNVRDEEPSTGEMGPLPAGWYNAMYTSDEVTPNKAGNGAILKSLFTIVSGTYKGRTIRANYNFRNASEQAQRIARAELSALGAAVNCANGSDTNLFKNIPLKVKLKISPFTNQAGETKYSNDIIAYRNINEQIETVEVETEVVLPVINEQVPVAAASPNVAAPAFFVAPQTAPVAVAAPIPFVAPAALVTAPVAPIQAAPIPPAILGQAPVQAWQAPAPAPVAPVVVPANPIVPPQPTAEQIAAWQASQAAQVAAPVAPAPVVEAAPVLPFDPTQPPAWMTAKA